MYTLINDDCLNVEIPNCKCLFADPPDNIGLRYHNVEDNIPEKEYVENLDHWLNYFISVAEIVWFSFNVKWIFDVCNIVNVMDVKKKMCVQTFTFGNYNDKGLTNCYRPLLLLHKQGAVFYPDAIRVRSRRQELGDARANPKGRIPGDVFDFPRVVGNAKERRSWHPTQLNEELVRRCLMFSSVPNDLIVDPFAGTGTVLRVCRLLERPNLSIEISPLYCENIATENKMVQKTETEWTLDKPNVNVMEHYFG